MTARTLRLVVTGLLVVVVLGACGKGDPKADAPLSDCEPKAPSATENARRFRDGQGLDASDEAIKKAASNDASEGRFGTPLTAAEVAAVDQAEERVRATEPLRQIVHDHPDQYGQLWIDRHHDSIAAIEIAPAGSEAPIRAAMSAADIDPSLVRFEQVKQSMAEQLAIVDNFTRVEQPKLKARGINLIGIGPALGGEVRADIENLDASTEKELETTYPNIDFRFGCPSTFDSGSGTP